MAKISSVEDEPFLQKFIEFHLKRNGHEIRVVPNGEQALAMVKSDRPDLILLDLKMPVMGGFRVLKELKEDRTTKNIPVIMLSANRKQHDIDAGLESGVFDYVTKPFDVSNLLERIEKALASIKYPANTPQIAGK